MTSRGWGTVLGALLLFGALMAVLVVWGDETSGAVLAEAQAEDAGGFAPVKVAATPGERKRTSKSSELQTALQMQTITDDDPQLEIIKAREKKKEAEKAQAAAKAAKGIATMVYDSARKLIGTIADAKEQLAASKDAEAAQAAKEKKEAAEAVSAAKAEVRKAKRIMSAAKSQAEQAKELVGQYLSSDRVQSAEHDYSQRKTTLQAALAKSYGGSMPEDGGDTPPPAAQVGSTGSTSSVSGDSSAQVQKIGEDAADEVIKSTFGSWGAGATEAEMDGIPQPATSSLYPETLGVA